MNNYTAKSHMSTDLLSIAYQDANQGIHPYHFKKPKRVPIVFKNEVSS